MAVFLAGCEAACQKHASIPRKHLATTIPTRMRERLRLTTFPSYILFQSSITWHRRRGLLLQLCVRIARQEIGQDSMSLYLRSSYHLTMLYTGNFVSFFFPFNFILLRPAFQSNFLFQYNVKLNYYVFYNALFKRKIYLLRYCNKQLLH